MSIKSENKCCIKINYFMNKLIKDSRIEIMYANLRFLFKRLNNGALKVEKAK